jgi:hypothetical protein
MRVGRYINEVCALFDVTLIIDVDGTLDSKVIKVSVALGVRTDDNKTMGETGYLLTNWFPGEDELDEFCELNINRFRIAASAVTKGADMPDAREWR